MQIKFRAIVQSEYGPPEKVLRIADRHFKSEELGVDDVLVKVRARPVHPGDTHILFGLPQGGPIVPIPEGTLRAPGFEGVGTILQIGANPEAAKRFTEGRRVAFCPALGSLDRLRGRPIQIPLASFGRDPRSNCGPKMLINTVTASVLIRAGHNSLKPPIRLPVYILQNASASGVGRLLTQVALDRGVRPIRLVRSNESAERLRSALPGPPVYSTSDSNWKQQVHAALDGKAIDDLAELV
jgi:NADPH:quinone reductase-like Zn-dependent oxidoreductase